jgi:hypothetical protein
VGGLIDLAEVAGSRTGSETVLLEFDEPEPLVLELMDASKQASKVCPRSRFRWRPAVQLVRPSYPSFLRWWEGFTREPQRGRGDEEQ